MRRRIENASDIARLCFLVISTIRMRRQPHAAHTRHTVAREPGWHNQDLVNLALEYGECQQDKYVLSRKGLQSLIGEAPRSGECCDPRLEKLARTKSRAQSVPPDSFPAPLPAQRLGPDPWRRLSDGSSFFWPRAAPAIGAVSKRPLPWSIAAGRRPDRAWRSGEGVYARRHRTWRRRSRTGQRRARRSRVSQRRGRRPRTRNSASEAKKARRCTFVAAPVPPHDAREHARAWRALARRDLRTLPPRRGATGRRLGRHGSGAGFRAPYGVHEVWDRRRQRPAELAAKATPSRSDHGTLVLHDGRSQRGHARPRATATATAVRTALKSDPPHMA